MLLRHPGQFGPGYEAVVGRKGPNADMLMDFGVLSLDSGATWHSGPADEKALLLMAGSVEFFWPGGSARCSRQSLLEESPAVLHLSEGAEARVVAGLGGAELAVTRTANARVFPARLHKPGECASEERGRGTMRETSTRIVRTVFDDTNAKDANLVLGEVINAPGKWSSYPPHHHPQPEIYHYRFLPERGFGLCAIGEEAHLLRDRDTVLIREGQVHPHVTAPGYSMWYLWVIRHLEGRRYKAPYPIFVDEHKWAMEKDAKIWELPSER